MHKRNGWDVLMDDGELFACEADSLRAQVGEFLTNWFGERCPDFEENCECCRRWALADALLKNPWQGDLDKAALA